MIQLYTTRVSSGDRCHWMLCEAGVPFELRRTDPRDPAAREELRRLKCGDKIPVLVDDEIRLCESVAINFYLAERYAPWLFGPDVATRARAYQWSLYCVTNLLPEVLRFMAHALFLPRIRRDPGVVATSREQIGRYLAFIEDALSGDYILGDAFSVADVNAGSIVNSVVRTNAHALGPRTAHWLQRLRERSGFRKVYGS